MARKPKHHHPHPSPNKPAGKGGGKGGGGKPSVQPGGVIKRAKARHHHHPAHHHHGGKGPKVQPGGVIKRAKHHPKRHLAGPPLGGWWITGGNDIADNCAAVAVANSLLLATGYRLDDGELLRLHDRAGPLSIPESLAALGAISAASFEEVRYGRRMIVGLATPHGPHAALWTGGGLVTWGGLIAWPDDWLAEEMWAVTW